MLVLERAMIASCLLLFLSAGQPSGRLIVENKTIYDDVENTTKTYSHWSLVVTSYDEDNVLEMSSSMIFGLAATLAFDP